MDECSICMESFLNRDMTTLRCSHTFHTSCIYNWFTYAKSNSCPICREIHSTEPVTRIIINDESGNIIRNDSLFKQWINYLLCIILFLLLIVSVFIILY